MAQYLDAIRFNLPTLTEKQVKRYYRDCMKTEQGKRTLELFLYFFIQNARRSFYDD